MIHNDNIGFEYAHMIGYECVWVYENMSNMYVYDCVNSYTNAVWKFAIGLLGSYADVYEFDRIIRYWC